MCGSWTKIAVLLKKKFGFIWDLLDVFTVQICSERIQYLESSFIVHSGEMILRIFFFNDDDEKCEKYSKVNLLDVEEYIFKKKFVNKSMLESIFFFIIKLNFLKS